MEILLLILIPKSQGLQVTEIPNTGYFLDPISEVRLLDHFHNFLFFVNSSDLERSYQGLVNNSIAIVSHSKKLEDVVADRIFRKLLNNLDEIKQIINKLGFIRIKRGIIDGLGTVIKFISGNPDANDLKIINDNLMHLNQTQKVAINKINELTSLANHITSRLAKETEILNSNIFSTKDFLQNLQNQQDFRLMLENEVYQSDRFLNKLLMIERTITLSWHDIPNLEIITTNEIKDIYLYLSKTYSPKQVIPYDSIHPFRLLKGTRMKTIGSKDTITFLLQIPILKPYSGTYSKFYPIPNNQDILIIPPKSYVIQMNQAELWTDEDCAMVNNFSLCLKQPTLENCSTTSINQCNTAKAVNNFKIIHLIRSNQILAVSKEPIQVVEDCHGILQSQSVQGRTLLDSPCSIIIGTSRYEKTTPIYEIKLPNMTSTPTSYDQVIDLKLKHFTYTKDLQIEAIKVKPFEVSQWLHYSATSVFSSCLLILFLLLCCYHRRILELLCKPRTIVHVRNGATSQPPIPQGLNEDVQT